VSTRKLRSGSITRRDMLKGTGLVLGGLAVPGFLESCLTSTTSTPSGSIKIGFVSPITGPASGFGEPDAYVLGLAKNAFKNGITVGGTNYSVEIVSRDGRAGPHSKPEGRPDAGDLHP
jgi:branched-chain amino acid transport system substrate-binding protein